MSSEFSQKPSARSMAVIAAASAGVTALVILIVIPAIAPWLESLKTAELIAVVAVVLTAIAVTWQIIVYQLKNRPRSAVQLSVAVQGDLATITAEIRNTGGKRTTPRRVYLFIDEGILREGVYDFPFLLKHEGGEYDCVLSKACKQDKLSYPKHMLTKEFAEIHTDLVELRHLSAESILFIDPGEGFTEDAVVKLPRAGVYRAILIFTARDADCLCASREFIIGGLEEIGGEGG